MERKRKRKKILFLCYGNSCRSILAEALARHFWGDDLEASSAGLVPLGHITPHTLEASNEVGISSAGLYSKGLSDIHLENIDYLVNLTDLKIGNMIPPSFSGKLIPNYVRDPYGEGIAAFRKARIELERLVREKLPRLIAEDSTE
jgi:protein-tyrosine-phosphatase